MKFRDDFYKAKHPEAKDIYWVIEVAHSTLGYDREYKIPLYAASNVKECWIVDVENKKLEIYRSLVKGKYKEQKTLVKGDSVKLIDFDLEIPVKDLLG